MERPVVVDLHERNTVPLADPQNGISRYDPIPESEEASIRLLKLEPCARTQRHNHTEVEFWTVIRGGVRIAMDHDSFVLGAGQSIRVEPLRRHRIEALEDGAIMQTVWWHNREAFERSLRLWQDADSTRHRRLLLVPAMLTPNGPMHIGHAAGPFVYADIVARIARLAGRRTTLVQGTHGHLEHIAIAAEKAGLDYYELADRNRAAMEEALSRLGVATDVFLGTRPTPRATEIVHEVFAALRAAGLIVEETTRAPFDPETGTFRVDAHVHGGCPYCGGYASGTECEDCGALVSDAELSDPVGLGGEKLERRPLTRLMLDLGPLAGQLEAILARGPMPTNVRLFVDSWLARGLPKICITNPNTRGVPVPLPGFGDQRFTVAMEYVPRHLLAVEEIMRRDGRILRWRDLAPSEYPELQILCGEDNAFGRLIVIPAVLAALGLAEFAPSYAHVNAMLTLDGRKFSTSRNHAIWVNDYVDERNAEALRFYLCRNRPERTSEDFTHSAFDAWRTDFWERRLGGMIAAVERVWAENDGDALPYPGQWTGDDARFYDRVGTFDEQIRYCYRPFGPDIRAATRAIEAFVDDITVYAEGALTVPKGSIGNSAVDRTESRLLGRALISIVVALAPLAPRRSGEIGGMLGLVAPDLAALNDDWMMRPLAKRRLDRTAWAPGEPVEEGVR